MTEQDPIENEAMDRQLSGILRNEPVYKLSHDFERKVMACLSAPESARDLFWLWMGLTLIVLSGGVAIFLTGFKLNFGALRFLSGHSGLFIFGIGFILALQWVEKKWLRKPSF